MQSFVFIVAAAAVVGVMGQYVYVVLFKILISIRFYYGPKIKRAPSDFVHFVLAAGCAHHSNGQLSLWCDDSIRVFFVMPVRATFLPYVCALDRAKQKENVSLEHQVNATPNQGLVHFVTVLYFNFR